MTAARRAITARRSAPRLASPPFPPAECLDSGRGGLRAAGKGSPARRAIERPTGRWMRLRAAAFPSAGFHTAVRNSAKRRVWNNQPAQSVFFAFRKIL